jgi:hypothetical protein
MPRPYPPPPVPKPTLKPFVMDLNAQRHLGQTLGLTHLPQEWISKINHSIACYRAIQSGNRDTTIANIRAALAELYRPGRSYEAAVSRLASDDSGVDDITLDRLQPLAQAVLAGDSEARKALARAAEERDAELRDHPRIVSETEPFRFFCGKLRPIFIDAASPSVDHTLQNCRRFALEVFTIAGIERADYDAHPERLNEYLLTDVPPD